MGVYLFDHYLPWWVPVAGALIVTVVTVVLWRAGLRTE